MKALSLKQPWAFLVGGGEKTIELRTWATDYRVDLLFDGDARFSEMFADPQEVDETKDALREIKEHRKESTARLKEENQADFYFVVVCRDQAEKDAVLQSLHIPKYENFVSGDSVLQAVKHG